MKLSNEMLPCEVCNEVTATYRPQFNRTLCLQHAKELEVERSIDVSMATVTEQLAADLLQQHQLKLSKKNIIAIMKTSANKSLTELELD